MDNFIIDLIFTALVFWAGYLWGKATAVRRIIENITRDPEHLGKALDEYRSIRSDPKEEGADHEFRVEEHGGVIYLYDADSGEFLAQADTLKSALELVTKRFPDRRYEGEITRTQAEELGIKP
jgi:hypothetical protein